MRPRRESEVLGVLRDQAAPWSPSRNVTGGSLQLADHIEACEQAPAELFNAMADVLGIELDEPAPAPVIDARPAPARVEPPPRAILETVPAAPPAEPRRVEPSPQPQRPSTAELRAAPPKSAT